jgi:hypothetical protein
MMKTGREGGGSDHAIRGKLIDETPEDEVLSPDEVLAIEEAALKAGPGPSGPAGRLKRRDGRDEDDEGRLFASETNEGPAPPFSSPGIEGVLELGRRVWPSGKERVGVEAWLSGLDTRPWPGADAGPAARFARLPVLATTLLSDRVTTWRSAYSGTKPGGVATLACLGPPPLPAPGAVAAYSGWFRAESDGQPDDRWRIFRLRTRGVEPWPAAVELFALRAARGDAEELDPGSPFDCLRAGALAGAWEAAGGPGWDDSRRRGLAYLILTRMEQLGREAAAELAGAPPPAAGPRLADVARHLARRVDRHRLWLVPRVGLG